MMNSKEKSLQQLKIAEHLLSITFPLVKDPKLLIGIIHNLSSCLDYALESVLPENMAVPKSLNGKIEFLRHNHHLPEEYVDLIRKIGRLIEFHKKSPVVFKRGEKQVICNDNYDLEVLSAKEIENLIDKTKRLISHIGVI